MAQLVLLDKIESDASCQDDTAALLDLSMAYGAWKLLVFRLLWAFPPCPAALAQIYLNLLSLDILKTKT